ncbi:hypothetical protein [Streptomyces sp. NPDC048636]|uniref:hypothetical protein n=1 Tax=Streptomyces sp. NPDC048636 TaxID=3155762 RepID=UPI003447BD8F
MNIGKKAIFLNLAAGALVIGGAAGAVAQNSDGWTPGARHCDTVTGAITPVGGAAPTGDLNIGAHCVSQSDTDSAVQSNHCETVTGDIAPVGGAAPAGDINIGATCASVAAAG